MVVELAATTNYEFQSTLLRKERRDNITFSWLLKSFNPRSYERSDSPACQYLKTCFCFNPRSYERSDSNLHKSSSDFVLFLSNYTSSCFTLQADKLSEVLYAIFITAFLCESPGNFMFAYGSHRFIGFFI